MVQELTYQDYPLQLRGCAIGKGVEVKHSAITSNATLHPGLGLFATRRFGRNEVVTSYQGKLLTKQQVDRLEEQGGGVLVCCHHLHCMCM